MKHAENDILELFVNKSGEMLILWESYCLEMEQKPSQEIYNELFRITHSLKGFSMNAGLPDYAKFVHQVEELIVCMIQNKTSPSQYVTDLLLDCKDSLQVWTDEIRYDKTYIFATSEISNRISSILDAEFNKKNLKKQRVMIIDHPGNFTKNLSNLLGFSFEVTQYTSTSSALNDLEKFKPDLIITEIRAKDIDGIDLIKKIKKISKIPVIAYSQLFPDELNIAKKIGANEVIKKNNNIVEVSMAAENLLNTRKTVW